MVDDRDEVVGRLEAEPAALLSAIVEEMLARGGTRLSFSRVESTE